MESMVLDPPVPGMLFFELLRFLFTKSTITGLGVLAGKLMPVEVLVGECFARGVDVLGDPAACPELALTCRLDSSIASKSEPGIASSLYRS